MAWTRSQPLKTHERGRIVKKGKNSAAVNAIGRKTRTMVKKVMKNPKSRGNIKTGSIVTWPIDSRGCATDTNSARSIGKVWAVHTRWLLIQYYASGWDMAERNLDVCVQDKEDYVLCDVLSVITRDEHVRELDIYDMESDRLYGGLLETAGNEGKGKLWTEGDVDQNGQRLAMLLRGPL